MSPQVQVFVVVLALTVGVVDAINIVKDEPKDVNKGHMRRESDPSTVVMNPMGEVLKKQHQVFAAGAADAGNLVEIAGTGDHKAVDQKFEKEKGGGVSSITSATDVSMDQVTVQQSGSITTNDMANTGTSAYSSPTTTTTTTIAKDPCKDCVTSMHCCTHRDPPCDPDPKSVENKAVCLQKWNCGGAGMTIANATAVTDLLSAGGYVGASAAAAAIGPCPSPALLQGRERGISGHQEVLNNTIGFFLQDAVTGCPSCVNPKTSFPSAWACPCRETMDTYCGNDSNSAQCKTNWLCGDKRVDMSWKSTNCANGDNDPTTESAWVAPRQVAGCSMTPSLVEKSSSLDESLAGKRNCCR